MLDDMERVRDTNWSHAHMHTSRAGQVGSQMGPKKTRWCPPLKPMGLKVPSG